MDTTVQKWGNSLAIRLPKAFADEIGLDQGSEIDIQIIDVSVGEGSREYLTARCAEKFLVLTELVEKRWLKHN